MSVEIHDRTRCLLGEGPLWHPERQELFWFDILDHTLMVNRDGKTVAARIGEYTSAAGWIDRDTLLIASAKALHIHNLETGATEDLCALEADNSVTRSNDGRADPWGGFWIGTMGIEAEDGAGAIYRYYKGELRKLYDKLTITNAICFHPSEPLAYWTDTPTQIIHRTPLDEATGWPAGDPEIHIDLRGSDHKSDGAVTDADGNLWSAQWGSWRVACYNPSGEFLRDVRFGAKQTSCPAFGGPDLTTLFCTTASVGIPEDELGEHPDTGKVFAAPETARGHPEHRVIL